jgi:hypothetical protein
MNASKHLTGLSILLAAAVAQAELNVTITSPRITGSKTLVKVETVNGFAEQVESARAVCFLLDEHGKMVGQSTQWVIGSLQTANNRERAPLEPGKTNVFHFVIPIENLTTTNLSARLQFNRVLLQGGKSVDVRSQIKVTEAAK